MIKTDEELINDLQTGTLEAFDQLMQRYQEYVFRIAYGFGKSKQNAMDISQNVFLKSYEKLNSFKKRSTFKAWIGRITYNEGINWAKKNRRYISSHDIEEVLMNQSSEISQEDELLAKENKAELLKSLFALNTKYRLAVVLRYLEDMPIKRISGVLNCSEEVVKNILHRSLKRLRQNLKQQSYGGGYESM